MGSVADCYDNAMCESFLASLECELLDQHRFRAQAQAKMAVFDYIEGFYDPRRRPVLVGLVIGLLLAGQASRLIGDFLVDVSATDPGTYAAAAAVLVLVATMACLISGLRATSADPAGVLMSDCGTAFAMWNSLYIRALPAYIQHSSGPLRE